MIIFRYSSLEQQELLDVREYLDRRRLEEGFLLFASLEMINKHNMMIEKIPFDRIKLVEMVGKDYQEHFDKKWTGSVADLYSISYY